MFCFVSFRFVSFRLIEIPYTYTEFVLDVTYHTVILYGNMIDMKCHSIKIRSKVDLMGRRRGDINQ